MTPLPFMQHILSLGLSLMATSKKFLFKKDAHTSAPQTLIVLLLDHAQSYKCN
ncbi:hypothetical protein M33023_01470 [Candidatus Phytoplasma asteris]|uniref:Uncharacterized protein n=1 Tax=Candidatus Phytoplasma asteris TaxID=85620 RepID=A0ABZ2YEK1_9MOLU